MTGSLRSMKREKAGKSERGNKMQLATSMNIGKVMDEEAKRERFASWYITLPGIPEYEKEMIEKSLKYNVWKELLTLFVVYMILSLASPGSADSDVPLSDVCPEAVSLLFFAPPHAVRPNANTRMNRIAVIYDRFISFLHFYLSRTQNRSKS